MNAIPRPLKSIYGLALQGVFGHRGLRWQVNGETFRIDPRVRRFVPHASEPTLFAFLRENLRPGQVLFDIGSFLGIYAMLAARAVGPAGKVLAFEPSRWSYDVLCEHVRMNALGDRIEARNAGVGAERQRRSLVTFDGEPYRNMIAVAQCCAVDGPSVDVVSVDEVCDGIGRAPDWIRMDVQGMEFEVLRGASRLLKSAGGRVRIVAETHPTEWSKFGVSPRDAYALLEGFGLRARSLDGTDPFRVETHALLEPA